MGYMWFSMYVRSFPVYPQQYKTHLFLLGSSDVFFFFFQKVSRYHEGCFLLQSYFHY